MSTRWFRWLAVVESVSWLTMIGAVVPAGTYLVVDRRWLAP